MDQLGEKPEEIRKQLAEQHERKDRKHERKPSDRTAGEHGRPDDEAGEDRRGDAS